MKSVLNVDYSWDPDALFRHQAKPYRKWVRQEAAEKKKLARVKPFQASLRTDTKARVERLVRQIVERRIDITQGRGLVSPGLCFCQ